VHQKLQEATEKLKQFEDARIVVKLDPARIRDSKWKNRDPRSYEQANFAELKEEIRQAGGNVQAVKVRRVAVDEKGDLYEIVYGRRRTRACLELGLLVNAVVEDLTDAQAYLEMHRENMSREDLSAWEQGVMYHDALAKGLFPSARKLAEALGVNQGNLVTAMKLAELPHEVVSAFPSPLELQFRWAAPLHTAVQADPEKVLRIAEAIREENPRPPSKLVFERLIGLNPPKPISKDLKVGRKIAGKWIRDEKGCLTVKLNANVLSKEQEKQVWDFLTSLLG
jgi:ParB family chromosome partitioning protein